MTPGKIELVPNATYSVKEAMKVLRLTRRNSVYEIPERDLPRARSGPRRGRLVFHGSDLIEYLKTRRVR